jgi:hypothetical protein
VPKPLNELELLTAIEEFERSIQGQPRDTVQELLRDHAREYRGRVVEVRSAVVASPYTREHPSHIYFGVNYDQNDHLYLSDIDPALHELLVNHAHWVSVVKTYPSRQIAYELPIDEQSFEELEQGEELDFECRIAALIRGKSVYCSPVDLSVTR